jgi:hypothetical protein
MVINDEQERNWRKSVLNVLPGNLLTDWGKPWKIKPKQPVTRHTSLLDMMPCILVDINWRFGGTCCLHLQSFHPSVDKCGTGIGRGAAGVRTLSEPRGVIKTVKQFAAISGLFQGCPHSNWSAQGPYSGRPSPYIRYVFLHSRHILLLWRLRHHVRPKHL